MGQVMRTISFTVASTAIGVYVGKVANNDDDDNPELWPSNHLEHALGGAQYWPCLDTFDRRRLRRPLGILCLVAGSAW